MTLPEKMYTIANRNSDELQKRFPPEVTSKLPVFKGGRKVDDVDFVAWHHYARKLNELFPLGWGVSISRTEIVGEYLLMVVDVKIGSYSYCGTGQAKADKQDWGGAHAEAYSQAFRRACAQPGLGLYFYGMEEMEAVAKQGIVDELKEAEAARAPARTDSDVVEVEAVTDLQLERLQQLAESNIFSEAGLDEYRVRIKAHYNKAGVGLVIREMKNEYRMTTGEEFSPS
jgi:hypothetical protein